MTARPRVSVVVPTRERPEALRRCLDALALQSLKSHEVIVVDDRSRPPAAEAVAAAVAATRDARLLRGEGRGPAAARNLGACAARANVVCLLDDDCEPEPRWLELLTAAVENRAGAVAGRTVAPEGAGPLAAASQAIATGLSEATHDARSGELAFAPSCNLACPRELLAEVPFDDRFPAAAGEDREWCARLLASGRRLVHEPDAMVLHHQRLTPRAFLHQHVRYGRGARRFQRVTRGARSGSGGVGDDVPRVQALMVRGAFRSSAGAAALVLVAQAATTAGFVAEALAERRA